MILLFRIEITNLVTESEGKLYEETEAKIQAADTDAPEMSDAETERIRSAAENAEKGESTEQMLQNMQGEWAECLFSCKQAKNTRLLVK